MTTCSVGRCSGKLASPTTARNLHRVSYLQLYDSAPICRPLPWSSQYLAGATSGPFDMGRVTGRPLDEDTQYGIRQFFCWQQQPKA